jgi:hypothetical protein
VTEAVAVTAEAATEAAEQEEKMGAIFKPPMDVSRCRSVLDLAQVQSTFLTKMAADHGIEPRAICKLDDDTTVIPK